MSSRRPRRAPGLAAADLGQVGDLGSLAHYADAAYYDRTYRNRASDVAWYVRRAKQVGGEVLELGAGSGRVALEVARAGLSVTAVDLSRPMLRALEAKLEQEPELRKRVRVKHADFTKLAIRRKFALVTAPFNVVLHLYGLDEVRAFFATVQRHLQPGGMFAFDFSMPQPDDLALDPNKRYFAPRFRHPTTGVLTRYAERFEYDPLRQLLVVWMEFFPEDGSPAWTVPLTHRQFFPLEMRALLEAAGFRGIEYFGDFSEAAPDAQTDSIAVICRGSGRKPAQRRR
ncbi:MAG: class I SAM-dependent methyltransferase [Polyangiaceae bacterium]